jgi:hypothetical protein
VGRKRNKRGEGETVAVALILATVGGPPATMLHITAAGAQDERGGDDARVGGVPAGCSFDPPDAKASCPSRWTAGDDSQRLGRC